MSVILIVLDGLGIGAMPDVPQSRPQDTGANTLRSLLQVAGWSRFENLVRLGLKHIVDDDGPGSPALLPLASYGRSRLGHLGADSYLGHQEIMGTIPQSSTKTLMSAAAPYLEERLGAAGYAVCRPLPGKDLLLVDGAVVIGDNLEADPGMNINLTVPTEYIDFSAALKIGRIVRQCVQVSRVIVFGGPGIDVGDILSRVEQRPNGQIGVDSPSLGVYNERLQVQHLGYGVDPDRQAASILARQGIPVSLIGKMADLIVCPEAARDPAVPTSQVMEAVLEARRRAPEAFIAATVQETDLAAHEGSSTRMAAVVEQADRCLGALLAEMSENDVLFICADHGNDPCVNVGRHTREETPLLIYQKGQPAVPLSIRLTLADIGATITALYNAPSTQDGAQIIFWRSL